MRGLTTGLIASALAFGAQACGDDNVVDGTGVRSGSRLRARYLVADGARQFVGFHDRERDEDCTFDLRPGQTTARCLPASTSAGGFMDAACSVPMFGVGADTCSLPTPYVHQAAMACGGGIARLWRVGTLQRPSTVYFVDSMGVCRSTPAGSTNVFYAAIEEVPLDRFVSAAWREAAGEGRVLERFLAGEDGSRIAVGAYDRVLDVPCTVSNIAGQLACHPTVSEGGWLWSDDTCTTQVVERDTAQFPVCAGPMPPYAAITHPGSSCRVTRTLVEIGPRATPANLYFGLGEACDPAANDGRELYELGAEVPFPDLAQAQRADVGSGRIHTRMLVADGARGVDTGLVDRDFEQPCRPGLTRDGVMRCLPSRGFTIRAYYGDAACGVRVPIASMLAECDGSADGYPQTPVVVEDEPPVIACGNPISKIYSVGAEYAPGTVYDRNGATCEPIMWERTDYRMWALGEEIAPDRFVAVDELTE
ncbi:MAG TPA: hypothetical protein VM261_28495 [Kofleriaceae bacterium]|nr:hypothetical protein [Kofleriaceae bacterium]